MTYPRSCVYIVCCFCILALPVVTYGASAPEYTVSVYLAKLSSAPHVTLSASEGLLEVQLDGRPEHARAVRIQDSGRVVQVCRADREEQTSATQLVIKPVQEDSLVVADTAAGRTYYSGSIELSAQAGRRLLVNRLELEDYVRGVLPAEMPELYPLEALKAQAVVARTYAVRNVGKHSAEGADLCDGTHCQSYMGVAKSKPRCAQAVAETRGMILVYRGKPAHVQYSADGGGATQDYPALYNRPDLPYLRGVRDPDGVPHTTWEATYSLAEIEKRLLKAGVGKAVGLASIRVSETTESGRVISVELQGAEGRENIRATKLRDALGPDSLRSTLFTIQSNADGAVTFSGRGWGHGIGLCQAGCKGLASPPFNHTWERLLSHYFPGTSVAGIHTIADSQFPTYAEAQSKDNQQADLRSKAHSASSPSDKPRPTMELRLIDPGHP